MEAYLTDAFGVSLGTQGTVTQPFGFTGQQQDPESGLYYLRARYYSPTLGRFISRDRTFGSVSNPFSLNRFGYALDNPVLLADPSGLSANKVTNNTADDNQCFSNGDGALAGNVINAACLKTPTGSQVVWGIAAMPPPPHWTATVVFAKTGEEGTGDTGDSACGDKAQIPGNPYVGRNAPGWANEHLTKFHGIELEVASNRLHILKEIGGLGDSDDDVIGRTGDVYNAQTSEWLGTLTDPSLGRER